jgi:hypothetical protein
MRRLIGAYLCIVSAITVASSQQRVLAGQDPQRVLPGVYGALAQCRTVPEDSARLGCFDATSAAMAEAIRKGELYLADDALKKAEQEATFGLAARDIPQLPKGAGKEAEEAAGNELTGTIRAARITHDGWIITLEDGSVWRQTDAMSSALDPIPGSKVTIKRAALGSYRLMLNKNVGFKAKRVQ